MIPFVPGTPSFALTPPATTSGTVVITCIPPGPNTKGSPLLYSVASSGGRPNWQDQGSFTHITDLIVTCSTTANIIYLMRPLNWTTFKSAVAKNATSITLTDDPGIYSTNYRYPLPGQTWNPPGTTNSVGPATADNALAANDLVVYQLADGTWRQDKIASGTFAGNNIVLSTGTPNVTGATIAAGSPLFWYGIFSDTNPATGTVHLIRTPIASTNQQNLLAGTTGGVSSGNGVPALNPGDPILVYNPNATATTTVDFIGGDYRRY